LRMNFILSLMTDSWHVLLESAPYILFGFVVAGLLKGFVPEEAFKKHLGGRGFLPVLKAALAGVPIPLCSCGVLPAVAGMRQAGAGKGAATAFLISTPETGVDSIAVNYALLDPIMTFIRPVAALVTGAVAGLLVDRIDPDPPAKAAPTFVPLDGFAMAKPPVLKRLRRGMAFAFGDMLGDIGPWFLFGVLLAGLIGALLPENGLERMLGTGIWPMLAMLAVGIPLYVCATASTPIAAALAMKGLSPGAALVFLLAGPATNAAGITVVLRLFGAKATAVYLGSIAACSLAFGILVDALYASLGLNVAHWLAAGGEESPGVFSLACAVLLLAVIGWKYLGKLLGRKRACCPGCSNCKDS